MTMEEVNILFTDNGLTISNTSVGLMVEFEDDGIQHGFSIPREYLGEPVTWLAAVTNLCNWMDIGPEVEARKSLVESGKAVTE